MTTEIETDRRKNRFGRTALFAALACLCGSILGTATAANAETRALKIHFVHTGEKAEVVFKRNGRYDAAGLRKVNMLLRDWRRNEPTRMDPRLLDVVWEAYRQTGSREYIHVVSGYRSPATNAMLRSRSRGVAKKSQHMLGKAMDFYIPGVKLKTLRNIGLRLQAGGVGYYPTSGSPFVHFDVGNVRHWPGISRSELASVFPNGNTLHVPSDGKPLPGYDQAMASYKKRASSGELAVASLARAEKSGTKKRSGGLLAAWFGGGADEEEDNGESAAPRVTPKVTVASAAPARQQARQPEIAILPPELAAPANVRPQAVEQFRTVPQEIVDTPETILAALPARNVPMPAFAPRPEANVAPAEAALDVVALLQSPDVAAVKAEPSMQLAAASVPVPAWRPDYEYEAEADERDQIALLALASTDPQSESYVPLPGTRPAQAVEDIISEDGRALVESLPAQRPGTDGAIRSEVPIRVASIPEPGSKQGRVLTEAGTKSAAPAPVEPGKTTPKAARVTPEVARSKPEAKPVVLAAAATSARWAIDENYVKNVRGKSRAPSFAHNIVRTAPVLVYTAGFQPKLNDGDPNRFTGKAVEFLSVAKFN